MYFSTYDEPSIKAALKVLLPRVRARGVTIPTVAFNTMRYTSWVLKFFELATRIIRTGPFNA